MSNLNSFVSLLPPIMQEKTENICFGNAFDTMYKNYQEKIKATLAIFSAIDTQDEEILDLLAFDLHIDVYNKNWDIEKKVQACLNSIMWHFYKGTTGVLCDVAKSLYGSARVQEWWEYNGLRRHFKIFFDLENEEINQDKFNELLTQCEKYKNLRSKLDAIVISISTICPVKILAATAWEDAVFVADKFGEPLYWIDDQGNSYIDTIWDDGQFVSLFIKEIPLERDTIFQFTEDEVAIFDPVSSEYCEYYYQLVLDDNGNRTIISPAVGESEFGTVKIWAQNSGHSVSLNQLENGELIEFKIGQGLFLSYQNIKEFNGLWNKDGVKLKLEIHMHVMTE